MKTHKKLLAISVASLMIFTACTSTSATSKDVTSVSASTDYFTSKDKDFSYDESTAYKITLNGDSILADNATVSSNTVTISNAGTYIISGTLENGQIIVDSASTDHVKLVLLNASISATDTAAIWIKSADKVVITVPEGTESTISDNGTYTEGDELPTATIFSRDDLVINGLGTLNVTSNLNDAISSRDDLKVLDTTLNVTSVDDALVGKDLVALSNANMQITSAKEGIKSSNDTDEGRGVVYIDGGTYNISSGNDGIQSITLVEIASGDIIINAEDDGIHSDGNLIINGGNIDIQSSYEGIEGKNITINNGEISVVSSDDGINVSGGTSTNAGGFKPKQQQTDTQEITPSQTEQTENTEAANTTSIEKGITINGGNITVTASGDGVDINGSGQMNGGTLTVNGLKGSPETALDYDGEFIVNGGELILFDTATSTLAPSTSDKQNSVAVMLDSKQPAGTVITLKSSSKTMEFTSSTPLQSFVVSNQDILEGETYEVLINQSTYTTFKAESGSTYVNKSGVTTATFNPGGSKGNMGMPNWESMPDGAERPTRPDGAEMPVLPDGVEMPTKPDGSTRPERQNNFTPNE